MGTLGRSPSFAMSHVNSRKSWASLGRSFPQELPPSPPPRRMLNLTWLAEPMWEWGSLSTRSAITRSAGQRLGSQDCSSESPALRHLHCLHPYSAEVGPRALVGWGQVGRAGERAWSGWKTHSAVWLFHNDSSLWSCLLCHTSDIAVYSGCGTHFCVNPHSTQASVPCVLQILRKLTSAEVWNAAHRMWSLPAPLIKFHVPPTVRTPSLCSDSPLCSQSSCHTPFPLSSGFPLSWSFQLLYYVFCDFFFLIWTHSVS